MGKNSPIYKRGAVWWHRDPVTRRRESTRCTDRKAALLYHSERERCAADPTYAAANTATLGRWIARVVEAKSHVRAEGTLDMYRIKSGHLARIIGAESTLSTVNPGTVDAYITARRREGAGQSTIHKEIVVLTQILKAARRAGEYRLDPKTLLPTDWTNAYTPRKRNLTIEEARRLLAFLPRERAAFVAFILATGARLSEASKAEPGDLDEREGLVAIRGTKTAGSRRVVPVLPGAAWLWEIVFRFWSQEGRAPRWDRASKGLPEACKALEFEPATPNDLRRTYASWLIHSGVEQGTVSRALGHRDGTMVARVYGQLTGAQLSTLIRRQIAIGTNGTQSDDGASENSIGPLGGMADAGDLKSTSKRATINSLAHLRALKPDENPRERVSSGTNSTHSRPMSLALHALAECSFRLGLLGPRPLELGGLG